MIPMMRNASLLAAAALAVFSVAPSASAQTPLTTTRVANGLTLPLYVTAPVGDAARLFILEQRVGAPAMGRIRILNLPGNTLNATPYLTVGPVNTGNEEGLLGLAFHPDFANNGFFFVYYTDTSGNNNVYRFTANAPFTTSTTAVASGTPVINFPHPGNSNHNGGWIAFGPDGYLYIGTGDGGSSNDPPGNAQNVNAILGKILRIDVDGDDFPADSNKNYANPPTNPFAGAIAGLDEIWLYGIRNPWRDSFDRVTGDLWIGDVGQNAVEEVDFVPAGVGGLNMGWRCVEGTTCTGLGCTITCPSPTLFTPPVTTYSHAGGACSITGGYRYRGTQLCGWDGTYFFADYCSNQIFSCGFNGTAITGLTNRTAQLAPGGGLQINSITSFGEDANGEIYICDQGGEVFKIVKGTITDCNGNGVHDQCDIASMTSLDANLNGVPDECEPSITPVCFGDGSGTPCPCGNNGIAGAGCGSSVSAGGGILNMNGFASVANDSLMLNGSSMPDGPVLYFQGTTLAGGGIPLGDGLLCVGGTIIRIIVRFNSGGVSSYPTFIETPLSIHGGITGGPTTRYYQAWYRDGDTTFCTAATNNNTNAVMVVWVN